MTFAYVMNKIAPGGGTIAAALAQRVKDIVSGIQSPRTISLRSDDTEAD